MIQITPQMQIFVCVEPVDFRMGIDGLCRLCRKVLGADLSPERFLFLSINPGKLCDYSYTTGMDIGFAINVCPKGVLPGGSSQATLPPSYLPHGSCSSFCGMLIPLESTPRISDRSEKILPLFQNKTGRKHNYLILVYAIHFNGRSTRDCRFVAASLPHRRSIGSEGKSKADPS